MLAKNLLAKTKTQYFALLVDNDADLADWLPIGSHESREAAINKLQTILPARNCYTATVLSDNQRRVLLSGIYLTKDTTQTEIERFQL